MPVAAVTRLDRWALLTVRRAEVCCMHSSGVCGQSLARSRSGIASRLAAPAARPLPTMPFPLLHVAPVPQPRCPHPLHRVHGHSWHPDHLSKLHRHGDLPRRRARISADGREVPGLPYVEPPPLHLRRPALAFAPPRRRRRGVARACAALRPRPPVPCPAGVGGERGGARTARPPWSPRRPRRARAGARAAQRAATAHHQLEAASEAVRSARRRRRMEAATPVAAEDPRLAPRSAPGTRLAVPDRARRARPDRPPAATAIR
jgi:hypothetical protein